MGYEINIAKNGSHYFATAERSIGFDKNRCVEIYNDLKSKFPENEGYTISVTLWSTNGSLCDMESKPHVLPTQNTTP